MKKLFVIFNVFAGIVLFLLLITMIDKKEYAEVVFEGPIFFGDLLLVLLIFIGPVVIGWAILKKLNRGFLPSILMGLGLIALLTTCYTLPSIRQNRILKNTIQTDRAIENLIDNRVYYRSDMKNFRHHLMELKMFHTIFDKQLKFLVSSEGIRDKRRSRVPMFFGILFCLLFLNALWLYFSGNGQMNKDNEKSDWLALSDTVDAEDVNDYLGYEMDTAEEEEEQTYHIQPFLRLIDARISYKEGERFSSLDDRIRGLLKTEIAELRVIRREYTKMFAQHLFEQQSIS